MKNKGFTLVELLAVIVILAIIMIIAIPSVTNSSGAAKEKTFQTKVITLETAAVMYGQEHYREIVDNANLGNVQGYAQESIKDVIYRTHTIKVGTLVPEYVEADTNNADGKISDPRENGEYLDGYDIKIKINVNTRKVYAEFIDPAEEQ